MTRSYRAALEAGINEAVFNEYVQVLGFSVDFQREIRNGDKFEMMYAIDRDLISGNIVGSNLKYVGLSLSGDQLSFSAMKVLTALLAGMMKMEIQPPAR